MTCYHQIPPPKKSTKLYRFTLIFPQFFRVDAPWSQLPGRGNSPAHAHPPRMSTVPLFQSFPIDSIMALNIIIIVFLYVVWCFHELLMVLYDLFRLVCVYWSTFLELSRLRSLKWESLWIAGIMALPFAQLTLSWHWILWFSDSAGLSLTLCALQITCLLTYLLLFLICRVLTVTIATFCVFLLVNWAVNVWSIWI